MRFQAILLTLATFSVLPGAAPVAANALSPRQVDAQIVHTTRQEGTCVESVHVVVCASADALRTDELHAFLSIAEDGAQRIRSYLGKQLDLPRENSRPVEFFVSDDVGIPHVTILNEPWIFIHPRAIRARKAPYLHEMVHAMAQWSWRNSEWVAEGFADYVASAVAKGHHGYHRSFILPAGLDDLHELRTSQAGRKVLPLIGLPGRRGTYLRESRELAQLLRSNRQEYAPPYYAMSWSFVSNLIAEIGVDGLRRVAESNLPSETLETITGRSMAEQVSAWENALNEAHDDNSY